MTENNPRQYIWELSLFFWVIVVAMFPGDWVYAGICAGIWFGMSKYLDVVVGVILASIAGIQTRIQYRKEISGNDSDHIDGILQKAGTVWQVQQWVQVYLKHVVATYVCVSSIVIGFLCIWGLVPYAWMIPIPCAALWYVLREKMYRNENKLYETEVVG